MSKGFASSYRIALLSCGLGVCFAGLGVRLVWLHVVGRDALLRPVAELRHHIIEDKARRGDIRDVHGARLATSHSLIRLGVDRASFGPKDDAKLPQLAALLEMPEAELRKIFTAKFRVGPSKTPAPAASADAASVGLVFNLPGAKPVVPAAPASAAPEEPAEDLEAKWVRLKEVTEQTNLEIQRLGLKSLTHERVYRRLYPNNQLASHIIGYVNKQETAVDGIEASFDFYLRGQDGWRVGEVDGRRRELAQFQTRKVDPSNGYDVFLSIDSAVQDIVEQELQYIAEKYQPQKATIIVSDPRSGFILGMGNYPTFNPNEYNKVPREEMARLKNIAITDVYEPGSVFKIVAVAAALEENLVRPDSTFDCSLATFEYKNNILKLPGDDHRYKTPTAVPLHEVVSLSSNRGAAQLGMRLGEERFLSYLHKFGFDRTLGYPGHQEVPGLLKPLKDWSKLEITRIPMGHSISTTVFQMHQGMTVIANGGVLLKPQVIREVRNAAGERVFLYDRQEINRVVSEKTARTLATMLTAVASKAGTAPAAAIAGFDVAGKTGTTQKIVDGKYSERHHVASFVGFFPANAAPGERQVAISVIIDDADHRAPNGVAYGGAVAAPSFRNIGVKLIPILDIKASGQMAVPNLVATTGGRP